MPRSLPTVLPSPKSESPDIPPISERLWRQFDDPVLDGLVADALAANLDLATAQAQLREARAQRKLARAALWPSVDASIAASRSKANPGSDTGIMNIMLVSVTERTREVGIRLAIGALEREVLLQFLIEAVVLSSLGGLIGIALATVASIVLSGMMQVPYLFDPTINLLSFLFSVAIGVIFGYFPALRAARLNPIEALRHE